MSRLAQAQRDRDELLRYVGEAKAALGDDIVTGQSLADAIAIVRRDRDAALAELQRWREWADEAQRQLSQAYRRLRIDD